MKLRCRAVLTSWLFTLLMVFAPQRTLATPSTPVPVWLYDAESYEFWRDASGGYHGLYPQIIQTLNARYGYNLQIRPIGGAEILKRFNENSYGLYAGVLRTDARARSKLLSARLFDNEVLAVSPRMQVLKAGDLNDMRVVFRRNDTTAERVKQRYPDIRFKEILLAESSEDAFHMLSTDRADFYINDATEMINTEPYYILSRPFPGLRIASVFAFSPTLLPLREHMNALINDWQRSGEMQQAIALHTRQFLTSRLRVSEAEREWLRQNPLEVWLPKKENFAPLIWRDDTGYHGSAINLINDLRELLQADVKVHYIDNYYAELQRNHWPIRLIEIRDASLAAPRDEIIGPQSSWHNAYYNLIGQPFIWDESQIRHQRVGVIKGAFTQFYLQEHYGEDVTIVPFEHIDQMIGAIENNKIDFILGDLSTLETSLRGNELFRGVLKVAGFTRGEYRIGPATDSTFPLHNLLAQVHQLSSYRTQLERQAVPAGVPQLTRNTLKIISVVLLITALFSLCLLLLMWRQMRKNRLVNRNIVQAMEKVNRAHDDETGSHIQRVAKYCNLMARELHLPRRMVRDISQYASLHDVGKIAVPEQILRKKGPLTAEEFDEMKLHTLKGWRIIQGLGLGQVAENIIHFHHEKWDGSGYPEGLKGEQIPLEARILALADVYDALRQKRVYKPGFSHEHASGMLFDGSGKHFDPRLVALFRQHHERFRAIYDALAD
ncbi:HD domain-containing phosphohydrolase [Vagococcus sp. WN89Y]|uniref:HD domain-containing phosphohydrolase n=1 Tax=Vagococcus sp. WN89Y TaxID=3457258 RepID=UPI003FCD5A6D